MNFINQNFDSIMGGIFLVAGILGMCIIHSMLFDKNDGSGFR